MSIKRPDINLPSVPEFWALIVIPLLYLYPLIPTPYILQNALLIFTFTPSFFTAFIAAKTSSDFNRFCDCDTPFAIDENRTHLILMLLSPLTIIVLLNLDIFFFNNYGAWHLLY